MRTNYIDLVQKVCKDTTNVPQAVDCITVAFMRYNLSPSLKIYVDIKGQFDRRDFSQILDEWEMTQPVGTSCFEKQGVGVLVPPPKQSTSTPTRKPITCFHCRKMGHISKECHSRLAGVEKQTLAGGSIKTEPQASPQPTQAVRPTKREVTCFKCQQKGHKSPQCPQRLNEVKKIKIPSDKLISLRHNELFGSVGCHRLPITCKTGADVSVVPEECILPEEFTGETCQVDSFNRITSTGKECDVTITIQGKKFHRRAVTQPGRDLAWTACLSMPYSEWEEILFIAENMNKVKLMDNQTCIYHRR